MNFEIQKKDNYTIIQILSDKIDYKIAPLLKSEVILLLGEGEKNIILDLSKCTYCDSEGLNAILISKRLCKNSNGTLVVGGVKDKVEQLISLSQLDKVLNIAYNINKAEDMMISLIEENKL